MPCRSPRKQYLSNDGSWTLSPDKAISSRCFRELPCGVCIDCRVRRTQEWAIRAYHESQMHERIIWVNPTFADNPITLSRKPYQIFFRSLRDAGHRFQYFGCGEYGEKLSRPHAHIFLFGVDFDDAYAWTNNKGKILYRSPTLEKHWPHGHILFARGLDASAASYTAGYTSKKIGGKKAAEIDPDTGLKHYEKLDPRTGEIIELMPEFVMCSLKPAIGKRWFEKNYEEIYHTDSVVMNGREYPIPRKYDEWLKAKDPEMYEAVAEKRLKYLKSIPRPTEEQREYQARARDQKRKHRIPSRGFTSVRTDRSERGKS